MKKKKNKRSKRPNTKQIAAFGAAMSTLAVSQVPSAQADIVVLTPIPTTVPYSATSGGSIVGLLDPSSALEFLFFQLNSYSGKSLIAAFTSSGFNIAGPSSPITTGQTFHTFGPIPPYASGTHTFGFITFADQVGWIQMNLGGTGGPIQYLGAAFNDTPFGSIHALAVPEPSGLALGALGLLAAGAREIRRRRKAQAQSQAASA